MKAVLEFTLPEERDELDLALRALRSEGAESLLGEIDEALRSVIKYESPSERIAELLQELRSRIHESGFLFVE